MMIKKLLAMSVVAAIGLSISACSKSSKDGAVANSAGVKEVAGHSHEGWWCDEHGVRRSDTFHHVLQALIELADEGSDERSVLERISNHLQARGRAPAILREVGLGVTESGEQE